MRPLPDRYCSVCGEVLGLLAFAFQSGAKECVPCNRAVNAEMDARKMEKPAEKSRAAA